MSHELRTPLNGIIGTLALLHPDCSRNELSTYLDTLKLSSANLLNLVNDILDLSKIDAGMLTPESIAFEPDQLLEEVATTFRDMARHARVKLKVVRDAKLSPWVEGDPTRIRQILSNLCGNAIKFSPGGEVQLRCESSERGVRFVVSDTGIGIASDRLGSIFESFVQEDDSTTREYGGTGLGLAICRELTHIMGGEIAVQSSLGAGSRFSVDLPLTPTSRPEHKSGPIFLAEENIHFEGKILLVEDNDINAMIARRLLERRGLAVRTAANGQQALDLLERERFDAVFMDCQMPIMDGYAATRALRALGNTTPVIALTANASSEDRLRCSAAGMDEHLSKPLIEAELVATLRSFLPSESSGRDQRRAAG